MSPAPRLIQFVMTVGLLTACLPARLEPTTIPSTRVIAPTVQSTTTAQPTTAAQPTAVATPVATRRSAGPAAPNRSSVTARVVSISPDPRNESTVLVQAVILTSAPVGGNLDFTAGQIGKPVVLVAARQATTGWSEGMTIRADIVFVGDEQGGQYHMSNIQRINP